VSRGESGHCFISIMAYAENGLIQDRQDVNILLWKSWMEAPEENCAPHLCYFKLMLDEAQWNC
jgi:hypothetical protein